MENKPGLYSARERYMGQEVVGCGNNGSADESSREFGCGRQSPCRPRVLQSLLGRTTHVTWYIHTSITINLPSVFLSLIGKFKCDTTYLIIKYYDAI